MPTRNRAQTLQYSIQTALFQDFDDYEIVVSDNCSTDHTADVVYSYGNPKIRYIRTPEPLAMSKNWEFGLTQACGTYKIMLSDDDGLLRNSLTNLHAVIRETGAKVIYWHRAQYNWPKYAYVDLQNLLIYTEPRHGGRFISSRTILDNAIKYIDCNDTPCLVNSAIHTDVFARLQQQTGKLILSYSPDTVSGLTIPCVVDQIYMYEKVNSIAGVSEFSNGTMLVKKEGTESEKEFRDFNRRVGEYCMTFSEKLGGSISAITLDSLYDVAKYFSAMVQVEKVDLARAYAQSIVEFALVSNTELGEQLIKRTYQLARDSHGAVGIIKVVLLVTRGKLVKFLNTPSLRLLASSLRMVLNKPYGSPQYFDGKVHGFSGIVGASEFLHNHILLPPKTKGT
jgi:glycosyltransferase involved in cell wall biosynthesis